MTFPVLLPLLFFALIPLSRGDAQSSAAAQAPVAYESATLPKDRQAAWEMLKAASGLHGDGIKPWYLAAHYKLDDADGHKAGEGVLTFLWAGDDRWYEDYKEGAKEWTR